MTTQWAVPAGRCQSVDDHGSRCSLAEGHEGGHEVPAWDRNTRSMPSARMSIKRLALSLLALSALLALGLIPARAWQGLLT